MKRHIVLCVVLLLTTITMIAKCRGNPPERIACDPLELLIYSPQDFDDEYIKKGQILPVAVVRRNSNIYLRKPDSLDEYWDASNQEIEFVESVKGGGITLGRTKYEYESVFFGNKLLILLTSLNISPDQNTTTITLFGVSDQELDCKISYIEYGSTTLIKPYIYIESEGILYIYSKEGNFLSFRKLYLIENGIKKPNITEAIYILYLMDWRMRIIYYIDILFILLLSAKIYRRINNKRPKED